VKKYIYTSKKRAISLLPLCIIMVLLIINANEAKAQKNENDQVRDKAVNNVSTWVNGINQKVNTLGADTNYRAIKSQSGLVVDKQVKESNPENYNQNKKDSIKGSLERIELTNERDAKSKIFKNPDGSFTKIQSYGSINYKDDNNKWKPLDGKLKQNVNNSGLYEITQTDLPISIDVSNGKTMMALEKNKYISFGDNVELLVLDTNFNEVHRYSDNKNNINNAKDKEIKLKNIWSNIDRNQQVDYGFAKTDYILNSVPNYSVNSGYLAFEDKVEIPQGWSIVKASDGTETTIGWQGDLLILNESGQEVGRFHLPIYYDNSIASAGNENCTGSQKLTTTQKSINADAFQLGYYRISKSANKYNISVIVSLNWLLSSDRSYPVTIDPTASNTYSSGNIASCYYSTFNSVNMNVTIPNGSTVTATNSQCTYVAVSPTWRSDGWIGFLSGTNLDEGGYWYCNVSSPGTCNINGTSNSTIANGTYSNGTVPFTLKVARDYPSGSCNTTYLYVSNSTWTETVTYCTVPGVPTLTSPTNNANVQPGTTIHFTWSAPTSGDTAFTYTLYFYNGSSWQNWSAGSNTYYDLQLSEYNSASWCGTNAQWYVKATNGCGSTNSATRNLVPYPKYSGSSADYTITPTSTCQTTGAHSIVQGGAKYYSFSATAGSTYSFSTCSSDLGCGTNTTWDTYLKIYGTDGSCTVSAYNDDGGACSSGPSFINGWTCSSTGTYYLQITGYNSSAYGTYYLQYKSCTSPNASTLSSPADNANIQPGKTTHYTWNAPSTGTGPFYYRFYFYNGSSWNNWACDTNRYIDLQLLEYNSASWCGVNAQWYVKDSNSCGTNTSATRNVIPYPKYSGSTVDYTITPSSSCQTSGAHSIDEGEADYYSFNATAGNTYYFSTCSTDLSCGTNTGWDTYMKIYGTNSSCITSAYNDDGGVCTHNESFINGWTCSTTGTYYLQITGYNSSAYGTYYLQYKQTCPTLTANLTGGSSPICYNTAPAMFTATGSGGSGTYTYLWYKNGTTTGVTTQNYTAPAMTANTTIYCAVSSCGQTVNTSTYNVTINSLPNANAGNDVAICTGSNTQLSASGGSTYAWSPATGLSATNVANPIASPTSTTGYIVTVTNSNGCSATDDITVTVNSLPTADGGTNDTICNGDTTQLNASGGTSYSWSPAAGLSATNISNPYAYPTSTITYYVTVTNIYGCTATDSVVITVNSLPSANAGSDVTICVGANSQLNASGGTSYSWSPAAGLSASNIANPVASPTITTAYTVTVTNTVGCSATDDVTVVVNTLPHAQAGENVNICSGNSATLTASGGTDYHWSTSDNTASITVAPTSNTTYAVTVSNASGCSDTDNVTVHVNNTFPIAEAGANTSVCYGSSDVLTASGGILYHWNTGSNTASTNVYPIATTVYKVTVTNGDGCTDTDDVTVTVNLLPKRYSLSSSNLNCSDGSAVLITLNGSEVGVNYQLLLDGNAIGSSKAGTGGFLYFGGQTSGVYTIRGTNATTSCNDLMIGSVVKL